MITTRVMFFVSDLNGIIRGEEFVLSYRGVAAQLYLSRT